MQSEHLFDVVVIGGGLHGAGIARDAAMRGYATLLVEREDFGCGRSSRSPGVAQGGLRHLARLEIGLVREALAERAALERIAPHLVRPLPCLLPVYAGEGRPLFAVGMGVKLYGWLAGERLARYRTIGAAEARRLEPALDARGLAGAALYTEGLVVSPGRLCLENVLSAREAGAKAVNHVAATALRPRADGVTEVDVRNTLTGAVDTVAGRVVVNAAGPWGDHVRRMAGLADRPTLRLTKTIHLVVPRVTRHALLTAPRGDGPALSVVPWKEWSVVGTTGAAFEEDLDRPAATPEEVDDLLDDVRRLLPGVRLSRDGVFHASAGASPMPAAGERSARRAVCRETIHAEGPRGTVLSVAGGSPAAYRAAAERVVDRIGTLIGHRDACRTGETPLVGGHLASLERALAGEAGALARRHGLPQAVAGGLVETYGSRAGEVLAPVATDPALARRLCDRSPDLVAQVRYAVDRESAVTLGDLLFRRLSAGTGACQGRDCAPRAAEAMARFAGWDDARREREVAAFLAEADRSQQYRRDTGGDRAGARFPARSLTRR